MNSFLKTSAFILFVIVAFGILNFSCKKVDDLLPEIPGGEPPVTPDSVQPNIIVILADDVGFEVPTCDGGQSYNTPNIDRMATEGIVFTQMHSAPLCSPSRFELLTGKYNFRNYGLWGIMDTTNRTLANMLRDAGYHTFVAGKWQLDGGDASIHALGFDDYLVHGPYTGSNGDGDGEGGGGGGGSSLYVSSPYKTPDLYYDGKKYTDSQKVGKFGDDLYVDSMMVFIDKNLHHPFFVYYPMSLCHYPFIPPPNNPDFATWDNETGKPDNAYFPYMISYMDDLVGRIMDSLNAKGVANKTIVMFTGDNGTDGRIVSYYNNKPVKGGKSHTFETGTRVPFIVWSPGNIQPGQVNNDLIDFTDLMPSLADMAHIPTPTNYGVLDGISFYPYLTGGIGTNPREWTFCHYDQNQKGEGFHPIRRWVQNTDYKLYDSTSEFFYIKNDIYEKKPLSDDELSPDEKALKANFAQIISTMHN